VVEHLPWGLRPSTLNERRLFYAKRFDAERAWQWVKSLFHIPIFAIKLVGKTKIYDPRFEKLVRRKIRAIYISSVRSPQDLRKKLAFYAPEGVYYWRNRVFDYDECKTCPHKKVRDYSACWGCENFDGQELVFDVDPENFCPGKFKDFASFTEKAFFQARSAACSLYDALSENFQKLHIFYSGRGFHIHVLDKDAWYMPFEERKRLADSFKDKGIDRWVTAGGAVLIRLPYSLNGVVNKEVTPLTRKELEEFVPYHSSSSSRSSSYSSKSSQRSSSSSQVSSSSSSSPS